MGVVGQEPGSLSLFLLSPLKIAKRQRKSAVQADESPFERECWCNGSLQRWTSNTKPNGRCDLCHRLCRAYPGRETGCGVERNADCDCKDDYGVSESAAADHGKV